MLRIAPALLAILAVGSTALAQNAAAPAKQPAAPAAGQNPQPRATANDPNAPARPQQPQPGRQPRQTGFRGSESASSIDSHIADCLILANQHEIALLKFGAEKSENQKVKEFAEAAIKDHEKAVQDLRKFASPNHANVQLQASTGAQGNRAVATTREARKVNPEEGKPAATPPGATTPPDSVRIANAERTPAAATADENSTIDRLFTIHQRAAQECIAMSEKELSQKKGEKFDECFLGQQAGMHLGMLAQLKALQGEVSNELQQVVNDAEKVTKGHKEKAEKLIEEVKGGDRAAK